MVTRVTSIFILVITHSQFDSGWTHGSFFGGLFLSICFMHILLIIRLFFLSQSSFSKWIKHGNILVCIFDENSFPGRDKIYHVMTCRV